jgi:hypothetical protein
MKLAREFIRLPLSFDTGRLAEEVRALPAEAWQAHPTGYAGNSAAPLISVGGEANDFFSGPMAETRWLKQSPYLRQVLASFQVVFGRSRLMGLAGGSEVPQHSDSNYHWFTRVRIHVPVITYPEVMFHCHDQAIHMAAGEAWVFDNWKFHRVVNPTTEFRVHLVADTVGSSTFWAMIDQSLKHEARELETRLVAFNPDVAAQLMLEQFNTLDVMHPGEMELLTEDLVADLRASTGPPNTAELTQKFVSAVRGFYQDWKSLWSVYGSSKAGWSLYENRRNRLLSELQAIRQPLVLSSNGLVAQKVMLARILVACVNNPIPGLNEIQFTR